MRSKSAASLFADNDVAKRLHRLEAENTLLNHKIRAAEKLLESGLKDRVKFLEGAQWLAQKLKLEVNSVGKLIVQEMKEFKFRF